VLAAIVPVLTKEQRRNACAKALSAAATLKRERHYLERTPGQNPSLLSQLAAQAEVDNERRRCKVLSAVAPYLTNELLHDALVLSESIRDPELRFRALAALAPHLTSEFLHDALVMSESIRDPESRFHALIALARHLTNELQRQCVAALVDTVPKLRRAEALVGVVEFAATASMLWEDSFVQEVCEAIRDVANWYP
jgi:hypothetical protein